MEVTDQEEEELSGDNKRFRLDSADINWSHNNFQWPFPFTGVSDLAKEYSRYQCRYSTKKRSLSTFLKMKREQLSKHRFHLHHILHSFSQPFL